MRRTRAKAKEWNDRVEADLVAAYKAGATLSQLSEVMEVKSIETPRQLLLRHEVELRSPGRASR
ncbi:MAG TPA: hypothetical protein VGW74_09385 [Propionibacteriaceae bacterium]|nr:hypothetical protein [Propionibacteriaceae bacterium]